MKNFFITGIGTDVGKTVVSAILTEALQADYWKPVQTGSFFGTDTANVKKWISNPKTIFHPEAYCLEQYMSPHAAAELSNISINLAGIEIPKTQNHLIIEGAGGIMVPLNNNEFTIDIAKKANAEVILVIQNYLGSINHSLLSIDVLKNRGHNIAGLIFNGPRHELSEKIILEYSGLKCLGFIGKEKEINKEIISKYAVQFSQILN
ncbi:MAG TPA: dethiobiotin synthase [Bacteroidia bacterium]|nr:dethiobiotin synthase [Bacteroidia bacterium]